MCLLLLLFWRYCCGVGAAGGTGEDSEAGQGDAGGHLPRKPRYDPCIDGEVETYFNLPAVGGGADGCIVIVLLVVTALHGVCQCGVLCCRSYALLSSVVQCSIGLWPLATSTCLWEGSGVAV
jgi:hypothetical protein